MSFDTHVAEISRRNVPPRSIATEQYRKLVGVLRLQHRIRKRMRCLRSG